jgi:hypothetical protein
MSTELLEKADKGKPPKLVTITINLKPKEVEAGNYTVAGIKNLGGIPLADELDEEKNGKLHPLHDEQHVEIKGGEVFKSQPRSGGSS